MSQSPQSHRVIPTGSRVTVGAVAPAPLSIGCGATHSLARKGKAASRTPSKPIGTVQELAGRASRPWPGSEDANAISVTGRFRSRR